MSLKYKELRGLTKEDLIEKHDKKCSGTEAPPKYWLNEIERRDREEHDERILGYTKQMTVLTWFIAAMTIFNVIIFFFK